MLKAGIFILSILPLTALCSQPVSSGSLLKACSGNILSLDEDEQLKVRKVYERMKPEEVTACIERDDDYRNYLLKKYSSGNGFLLSK